ncbi:MAG: hypothetical protein WCD63_06945, partial [Terrimicrobiaceae bacterium]
MIDCRESVVSTVGLSTRRLTDRENHAAFLWLGLPWHVRLIKRFRDPFPHTAEMREHDDLLPV